MALGRGQKVKYHLISISKIFIPNFVCLLTNERYKTYQSGFLFCRLGHALGMGHGGAKGPKSNSVLLPDCYAISSKIIGRNSTKFGVWVTPMNGVCNGKICLAPPPWGGGKSQISFNFNYSQFQRFVCQILCVYSQMKATKHI